MESDPQGSTGPGSLAQADYLMAMSANPATIAPKAAGEIVVPKASDPQGMLSMPSLIAHGIPPALYMQAPAPVYTTSQMVQVPSIFFYHPPPVPVVNASEQASLLHDPNQTLLAYLRSNHFSNQSLSAIANSHELPPRAYSIGPKPPASRGIEKNLTYSPPTSAQTMPTGVIATTAQQQSPDANQLPVTSEEFKAPRPPSNPAKLKYSIASIYGEPSESPISSQPSTSQNSHQNQPTISRRASRQYSRGRPNSMCATNGMQFPSPPFGQPLPSNVQPAFSSSFQRAPNSVAASQQGFPAHPSPAPTSKAVALAKGPDFVTIPSFETDLLRQVHFDIEPSSKEDGSDLHNVDLPTLRFFFNLGVQQFGVEYDTYIQCKQCERQHAATSTITAAAAPVTVAVGSSPADVATAEMLAGEMVNQFMRQIMYRQYMEKASADQLVSAQLQTQMQVQAAPATAAVMLQNAILDPEPGFELQVPGAPAGIFYPSASTAAAAAAELNKLTFQQYFPGTNINQTAFAQLLEQAQLYAAMSRLPDDSYQQGYSRRDQSSTSKQR